jgi:hypothetical protein
MYRKNGCSSNPNDLAVRFCSFNSDRSLVKVAPAVIPADSCWGSLCYWSGNRWSHCCRLIKVAPAVSTSVISADNY